MYSLRKRRLLSTENDKTEKENQKTSWNQHRTDTGKHEKENARRPKVYEDKKQTDKEKEKGRKEIHKNQEKKQMKWRTNIEQLFMDMGINVAGPGDRHHQEGWLNIPCPFCTGNPGNHLGWKESEDYFNCYRCGFHSHVQVLTTLFNIDEAKARDMIKQYQDNLHVPDWNKKKKAQAKHILLPSQCGPLRKAHKQYLRKRGFDPKQLVDEWDLQGTGIIGPYKFRIIAPIYHKNQLVSYQGRDITNRSKLKYKACPIEKEIRHHKHCLYGLDHALKDKTVVVVEGITDVWRLGKGAVSTFGINFMDQQLELLTEFDCVWILYDREPLAQNMASKMRDRLRTEGVNARTVNLKRKGDPAQLSPQEAQTLMKYLLNTRRPQPVV